jgi:hypothetical protein
MNKVYLDDHGFLFRPGGVDFTRSARERVLQVFAPDPRRLYRISMHVDLKTSVTKTHQISDELHEWFQVSMRSYPHGLTLDYATHGGKIITWYIKGMTDQEAMLFKLAWGGQ